MAMVPLINRYAEQITGTLSCFDRVVIKGTLPGLCYSEGVQSIGYSEVLT